MQTKYVTYWAKQMPKKPIEEFWQQLQKDKLDKIVFFDGGIKDFSSFYAWLLDIDKDARFIADNEGVIKAMYWLNNPIGKSVMIHFCFLKKAFCEQMGIGQYVVKSLLHCKDSNNEYVVSALIGITPKPYRHVFAFIKALGFAIQAEIPKACYFARKNSYVTGVVSLLQKETIKE